MIELEFSFLGDPSPTLKDLLSAFQKQNNVEVKLQTIPWNRAWPELLTFALYGRGPDVSHVGSTWASSLVSMNALRSFHSEEVNAFGGEEAFLPQCWQSVTMPGMEEVYAAPWTAYTFLLCYRRDLLQQAGIPEEGAFTSAAALAGTLKRLKAANVESPWAIAVDPSDLDTLHKVASWVWGTGGDLVTEKERLCFNLPAAHSGLKAYFELLQYLSPAARNRNAEQAQALFTSGAAAVTIVGADQPYLWQHSRSAAPEVLDNLGVAIMPGVPWIGGDNLVIWRHTMLSVEREKAALELVRYLVSQKVQQSYAQGEEVFMPTRRDTLHFLPEGNSQLTQATVRSLETGRAYPPLPMWSKIEHRFALALGHIGQEVLSGMPVEKAMNIHLEALSRYLEISLGNK